MRIGVISNGYPLTPEDYPGIFNRHFANALARAGHEVFVFTPDRKGGKREDEAVNVTWFPWRGGDRPLSRMRLTHMGDLIGVVSLMQGGSQGIRAFVREKRIEAIMAMWAVPSGWWALQARERFGVPFAVWALGADIWTYSRYPGIRQVVIKVLKKADLLYADGMELGRGVERLSGRTCDFLSTTRALPAEAVEPADLEAGLTHFLFVGRWERVKGIDVLLEAVRLLAARRQDFRLHLFGAGSLEEMIEETIEAHGLGDRIRVGGYATPETVTAYLKSCRAMVIPSRMESIPVVFSDALQMDVPLVVTDVGDMGELTRTYEVGLAVPSEDSGKLAEAMETVIEEGTERFRYGVTRLARLFSLEENAARFVREMEAVLADRPDRGGAR